MSALAAAMKFMGYDVSGSDRANDKGDFPDKFNKLRSLGIELHLQDGTGVTEDVSLVIVSSAVEGHIPDLRAARKKGIPILKRAQLLAGVFNEFNGIAVAGTSGKTTVTAMIGHILDVAEKDPFIVNGGVMLNYLKDIDGRAVLGNCRMGKSKWFVAETDESDGSISYFKPKIGVLNNISLDHKPLEELKSIFLDFMNRSVDGIVINVDDKETRHIIPKLSKKPFTVSMQSNNSDLYASNARLEDNTTIFSLSYHHKTCTVALPLIGRHNVYNALAAAGACIQAGIGMDDIVKGLESFQGVQRRLQIVGKENRITVIDDFAHNPEKIKASLRALRELGKRLIVMFQPHGYGPTAMVYEDLIETFARELNQEDWLLMPEIYFAGGTADKSVSSKNIVHALEDRGYQAKFFSLRADILHFIQRHAQKEDVIVVMGARDDSLSAFAESIYQKIKSIRV